ncbi:MAG: hypothetical protein ACOY93_03285 [Bacillota bacterium]
MGWQTLRDSIPTVVMQMAAAAVHMMAITGLGATLGPLYTALAAAILLAAPMTAVLAMLAGYTRLGTALFAAFFMASAGLLLYGYLGEGHLLMALRAAASPWKSLFFITAVLLPLLQVTGIIEAARSLFPQHLIQITEE